MGKACGVFLVLTDSRRATPGEPSTFETVQMVCGSDGRERLNFFAGSMLSPESSSDFTLSVRQFSEDLGHSASGYAEISG